MVLSWEAVVAGLRCGQVGVIGLPLIVGMENGGRLAQESKYDLAAAHGSWGSRRGN